MTRKTKTVKQRPDELTRERVNESLYWMGQLRSLVIVSQMRGDHEMAATIHKALRSTMQSVQRVRAKRNTEMSTTE